MAHVNKNLDFKLKRPTGNFIIYNSVSKINCTLPSLAK